MDLLFIAGLALVSIAVGLLTNSVSWAMLVLGGLLLAIGPSFLRQIRRDREDYDGPI